MFRFEDTLLWRKAFASQSDSDYVEELRSKLRQSFLDFRKRADQLANEIHRDLPDYTVHGVTHLDALWETASKIAGDEFSLTPTEAFVLGGGFLIHDLAMSCAAYPQGIDTLREEPIWLDTIASLLKRHLGRSPTRIELDNPRKDIEVEATRELLRNLHAKQAELLPLVYWKSSEKSEPYYLIDTPELRETYGPIIGRIAHSHWWPVDRLAREFDEPLGAPGEYPPEWEVDALKIAALLRVADASHLDDQRAPSFLWAIRRPQGISQIHWSFQNKLFQPRYEPGYLVYTAKRPFAVEDVSAWWQCFDTLQMVDRELRQVDALLMDSGRNRPRFAARGVARVETPERLAKLIQTEGWLPIDVRIKVTDVASLACHIGGEQLYGKDRTVPLRELIQNASDAVRARRLMYGEQPDKEKIYVRYGKDEQGDWIEVEDTGVGMSTDVLMGPLLDFGISYWGSPLMLNEHPGLLSKGFNPTGQYGIGFFSVFMWGERVTITTRQFRKDAPEETKVLEFGSGLESRPILRKARISEYLYEGGTRIRIWLKEPIESPKGILRSGRWDQKTWNLGDLCAWLCPSNDVSIVVEEKDGQKKEVVSASDWKSMDGKELLRRIGLHVRPYEEKYEYLEAINDAANRLLLLTDPSGEVIGRACISSGLWPDESSGGIMTVGGLRANELAGIAGILVGRPLRATRDLAIPIVDADELRRWASNQTFKIFIGTALNFYKNDRAMKFAAIIRNCGGDTANLPVAFSEKGYMSIPDIEGWREIADEVLIIENFWPYYRHYRQELFLYPGILAITEEKYQPSLGHRLNEIKWPDLADIQTSIQPNLEHRSMKFAVIEAIAKAWGAAMEDVLRLSILGDKETKYKIGKYAGEVRESTADVIRNPLRT